jgi:hypothetical protein
MAFAATIKEKTTNHKELDMIRTISFLAILLCVAPIASAKIWRLDNVQNADFSSITTAHSSAASGDTVYVAGSVNNYGSVTLTKKLTIIGPGYFLAQNPQTQANLNAAAFSSITFSSGSDESVVMGVTTTGDFDIRSNGVTIRRNKANRDIFTRTGVDNAVIAQNYIARQLNSGATNSNILVLNNIFSNATNSSSAAITAPNTSSLEISNNTLVNSIDVSNSTITNNIVTAGTIDGAADNNSLSNNLVLDANTDPSTVLANAGSPDAQWQLATNSAALGAGLNDTDQGAFGGPNPYVRSGIPSIPAIYFFTAPALGSSQSGLQVQLKAKGNN